MLKQFKLVFYLFLFFFTLSAKSQNIEIGSPFKTKKGKLMVINQSSVIDEEGNIYSVEVSRSILFSTALVIRKFDKNLKLVKEAKIKNEQGIKTLLAHLEFDKDKNLNIYTHASNILHTTTDIYFQKVDLKSLQVIKTTKLASIEYNEKVAYSIGELFFNKFYSYKNGKIFYALPYIIKNSAYVKLLEIDIENPSKNIEKNIEINSSNANVTRITNIFFDPESKKIHTTVEIHSEEESIDIYLLDYSFETNNISTKKVNTEGRTVKFNEITSQNGKVIAYGVYSYKNKTGVCYYDWKEAKDIVWLETDTELEGIGNLMGKKSYTMKDGSTVFICEEASMFTSSSSTITSGGKSESSTVHYIVYGNIIVYKIKDGKLEWLTSIKKTQGIITNSFYICSIGIYCKDDNVYIYTNSEKRYDKELKVNGARSMDMNLMELMVNFEGKTSLKIIADKERIGEKKFVLLPQYTTENGKTILFSGWSIEKRNIVKIDF